MHFKSSDLNQLTPDYVARLCKARVDELVEILRKDLLAAQDLLNRDSSNSSSPPSTDKPWNRASNSFKSTEEQEEAALVAELEDKSVASNEQAEDQSAANAAQNPSKAETGPLV